MSRALCLLLVALVAGACVLVGACGEREDGEKTTPNVPLDISHETTRIDSPLTGQGEIDYVAALNAGVAPAASENAAIPILRAVGTGALLGSAEAALARLGAPDGLPAEGSYVPAPGQVPYNLDFERIRHPEDEAVVVEWIAANGRALDALVRASERPRLWLPVVREPTSGMLGFALPLERLTDLCIALAARAESRRRDGKIREGWRDVEVLLRISGLPDQLPGTFSRLTAAYVRSFAWDWLQRALESSQVTEELCSRVLQTLLRIPPPRSLVEDIDVFERYVMLDITLHRMPRELDPDPEDVESGAANVILNQALRVINRAYDEAVLLVAEPGRESLDQLRRLNDERKERIDAMGEEYRSPDGQMRQLRQLMSGGGEGVGRNIGEVLAGMALVVMPITIERIHTDETKRHVATLAAALHLHSLDHGAFPDLLDALVPATLTSLPLHPLDGSAIPYERVDRRCRVGHEDYVIKLTR